MSVSNGSRLGPRATSNTISSPTTSGPTSPSHVHKILREKSQRVIEAGKRREAEWELEPDNRYSPDQFYMRASDAQGHKEHVRVNIPPYMAAQMSALVHSDKFPYQTLADIMRDALYHRLHHLSTTKDGVGLSAVVSRFRRESRLQDYLDELKSVDDIKESTLKIVDDGLDKRDYTGLRHELDQLMEDAAEYREPYRSDIRKFLKECYIRLNRAER